MNWLQRLMRRQRLEHELDAELQFHFDALVAEHRVAGVDDAEARRRAWREFGAVETVKDDCRRARGTEWLIDLLADARVGLRILAKEPGFAAVAVGALALGLGVNTVFFSVVNTYCLTGLPYANAANLVDIALRDKTGHETAMSLSQVGAIATVPFVQASASYTTRPAAVRAPGSTARRITVAYVSDAALSLIGETAAHGRAFRAEEYRQLPSDTALLSESLAVDLFAERAAVGESIWLDGSPKTVVGVLPRGARFPDNADLWQPLSSLELADDTPALSVFAQLREGANASAAAAQVDGALDNSRMLSGNHAVIVPLNDRHRASITNPVWMAFITAGAVVVIIACANVSNLLLARGVRRTGEIATRLSLGATRARIVRQLFAECLILVVMACGGALFVSWAGLRALKTAIPAAAIPYWATLDLDGRAVIVLLTAGACTVLLSGMAPAAQLVRLPGLPFTDRTTTHGHAINRWSSAFLVVQIAVSVLLLCAVDLTLQVHRSLSNTAAQAELANVLTAELSLSPQRYQTTATRDAFFHNLRDDLLSTSQVTSVSVGGALPGTRSEPRLVTGGAIRQPGGMVGTIAIDPDFFSTLGLPLLAGRAFTREDVDREGSSVMVNDRFAQLFFGTVSVIGRQIAIIPGTSGARAPDPRTIVAVVPSFRGQGRLGAPPMLFVPRAAGASARAVILLRGGVPPQELAPLLREAVSKADPDVPLSNVLPLLEATWEAQWNSRVSQALVGAIASVGLCLAMVGVAALTAHRIGMRARELSVRVALGATPARLLRAVLGPVLVQLMLGLALGALLAKLWERAFGSPIAGSSNLALVALLVSLTTVLFSAIPARRAAHADPLVALRADS